ncbi:hypothetical protein RND81_11G065400 [Saponaria officinalis]|uniref:C3H1-type domain-containing protein n=1 Tax=Saponaria officinalis TaxID=3572 RepID=A0AAW1HIT5_SAPOF
MQQEISSALTPTIWRMSQVTGLSDILSSNPYSSNLDRISASPTHLNTTSTGSTATAMIVMASLSRLLSQHKDLLNRFSSCASQLQKTLNEVEFLRQENTNLHIENHELSHQINLLLEAAVVQKAAVCSDPLQLAGVGLSNSEKIISVSATSVTEDEAGRVSLPKSISVRSNDYLKLKSDGVDDSSGSSSEGKQKPKRGSSLKTRTLSAVSGQQKVYVRGGSKNDNPIELDVFNQGMLKTELCNKWQETGNCPYKDHCQFAHGITELRPVIRHPRYKTEVCRMVLSGDPCPYGHRCHFRHALTPEEQLMLPQRLE